MMERRTATAAQLTKEEPMAAIFQALTPAVTAKQVDAESKSGKGRRRRKKRRGGGRRSRS